MRQRTLGVVGTLVWDTFVDADRDAAPREGWGGISYALSALAAALPAGWTVLPIVKIGDDLFDRGRAFLRSIPRVDTSALVAVPEPNNRVELRYESASRRTERLTGGVGGSTWDELAGPLGSCDAVYVNFVSGFEMELAVAEALAQGFGGPRYGDLHSLFLGVDRAGVRIPRALEDAWRWAGCFHAVQLNEDELALAAPGDDPWRRAVAETAVGPGVVAVTLGDRGSRCLVAPSFDGDPFAWPTPGARGVAREETRTITLPTTARTGDPTGCGDVWGATFFARLLGGDVVRAAMAEANRLAGLNVEHRAAEGLAARLDGSVAPPRADVNQERGVHT